MALLYGRTLRHGSASDWVNKLTVSCGTWTRKYHRSLPRIRPCTNVMTSIVVGVKPWRNCNRTSDSFRFQVIGRRMCSRSKTCLPARGEELLDPANGVAQADDREPITTGRTMTYSVFGIDAALRSSRRDWPLGPSDGRRTRQGRGTCDFERTNQERKWTTKENPKSAGFVYPGAAFDITDPGVVEAQIQRIAEEHGQLDILVNNAYSGRPGTMAGSTPQDFESAYRIAVTAVFSMVQLVPAFTEGSGAVSCRWSVCHQYRFHVRHWSVRMPRYTAIAAQ